jgi:hypothetical protein
MALREHGGPLVASNVASWKTPYEMEVLVGKSSINGGVCMAMFDIRRKAYEWLI